MRPVLISCALWLWSLPPASAQDPWPEPDPALLERAKALPDEVPLIDGHNDLPSSLLDVAGGDLSLSDIATRQLELPADLPRLREGKVGAQFWSAFVHTDFMASGESLRQALREIDMVHRLDDRYPDLVLARRVEDIERAHAEGKIASLIGLEGAHAIEGSHSSARALNAHPRNVPDDVLRSTAQNGARTAGSNSHHFLIEGKDDLA